MERHEFAQLVREAIAHLYEPFFLETHPLASAFSSGPTAAVRGAALRRTLLDSLEALRPDPASHSALPAYRRHRVLHLRYCDRVSSEQVCKELGISSRQERRDHQEALESVESILWTRYVDLHRPEESQDGSALPEAGDSKQTLLEAELQSLARAPGQAPTNLEESVRRAVAMVSRLAGSLGVGLDVELTAGPTLVAARRTLLHQALLGFLSYLVEWAGCQRIAISSSIKPASVELRATARRDSARADTGGSSDADPDSDSRIAAGRRLIGIEGGESAVVLEPGGELSISLSLPRAGLTTVLVVDDNPSMVRLFRRYLAVGPYRLLEANTAQRALQLAGETPPDVIVLDLMIPYQDGWEILEELKRQAATEGIPVIVCSVLDERALALSLGAVAFLAKPVTQAALLAALAPHQRPCPERPG